MIFELFCKLYMEVLFLHKGKFQRVLGKFKILNIFNGLNAGCFWNHIIQNKYNKSAKGLPGYKNSTYGLTNG